MDELLAWMGDKSIIASSDDTGKDLEHVDVLQKRFEDFMNDLTANELRIDAVHDMGKKLVEGEHPEAEQIQARQEEINTSWTSLKEVAAARKEKLANAKLIHALNRDADEISGRIK